MVPIAHPLRRLLILALAFLPLACDKLPFVNDSQDLAKERVRFVLGACFAPEAGKLSIYQNAACRWYADRNLLPDPLLEYAADGFEEFLREKNLGMESITQFSVEEIQEGTTDDPLDTLLVHVKINGELHWLAVPPKAPMSWR